MNQKKWLLVVLAALALLAISLGAFYLIEHPLGGDGSDTYRPETFVSAGDTPLTYVENLPPEAFAGTSAGDWLDGCQSPDRDEQFDAYVLRHESTEGGVTTFTYLIYYRHGESGLVATPTVLAGENGGYRVDLSFVSGNGTEDYALCRLSITLPTAKSPRLRLVRDDDTVGFLSTVTQEPIPKVGT